MRDSVSARCSRCGCKSCICGTDKDLMFEDFKESVYLSPHPFKPNIELAREVMKRTSEIAKAVGPVEPLPNWKGYPLELIGEIMPVNESKIKDTNPKDAVGIKKVPFSTISGPVMAELGLAMLEGARKYARHNYRVAGIRASVYFDAAARHLIKWYEGEDIDPDSGLNHVIKAIASLHVLRDAMIFEKWVDDRPPALPNSNEFWAKLNELAAEIIKRHQDVPDPYTEKNKDDPRS